ncbi:MAG TPA: hypothetical protein VFA09_01370 [Ktedonobacteraceae bacterium]|nr:hypothetical protein [Ktedonobacteraceae bacterium]HZU65900.1 hypothetical protein [Ktedonobacteraceae bacterium]
MDTNQISYEQIKGLARQLGQRVTDLIPLAPQNDPFYTGTPNDWALAEWFAGLWQAFQYTTKVHIRRVHYQIVSQHPPVLMPNGLPYENTETCWNVLNLASKAARYLRLVDPAAFNDRRNPDPLVYATHRVPEPDVRVRGRLWESDFQLPDFPALPYYSVSGYQPEQAYHLELWCEKSTMNDVLEPLCQHYGMNLQTGLGELSITATLALARRLEAAGKPARIFYVSDFDPAGQSMPVSVSRKVEYFVRTLGLDVDVRVFPVILTLEQVQYYRLPRTPIKETERRRGGFEERYGEGAVELDALEALYPGELQALLQQCIACYYDTSLSGRVQQAEDALERELSSIWQQVTGRYAADVEALRADYEQLREEFAGRMAGYSERLQVLWHAVQQELSLSIPHLEAYPLPAPAPGTELGEGLYNSARDYLEQIEAYKQFQGKLHLQEA